MMLFAVTLRPEDTILRAYDVDVGVDVPTLTVTLYAGEPLS